MHLLQITSRSIRQDHCIAAGGDGEPSTGDAFVANNVMQSKERIIPLPLRGDGVHRQLRQSVIYIAACVPFMFGKTSLASSP